MTREEVKRIIQIIVYTYPNFKVDNLTNTLDAWHFFLADYDYNDIAIALKTFVNTSGKGFAPSVDQLIAMAHKPAELNQLTESQAWDLVSKAIRKSIYYAEEEYNKLPEAIQECITPTMLRNWAETDMKTLESVVASNFQRSFRVVQERREQKQRLPVEARAKLGELHKIALEDKHNE